MEILQQLLEDSLKELPNLLLQKRLAPKFKKAGINITKGNLAKASSHILSGNKEPIQICKGSRNISIEVTEEDLIFVIDGMEKFLNEKLEGVLEKASNDCSKLFFSEDWTENLRAIREEMGEFRERLEDRWGIGLNKLRLMLEIAREWGQRTHAKRSSEKIEPTHFEEVLLRLHVRACQITHEIITLLENGFADGAMARWRTLHEVSIVAATIFKFGEDIAERYVHYQIVESYKAVKSYERDHKGLGFKGPSQRQLKKITRDYDAVLVRFGRKFGEEYGWAAHHLNLGPKERGSFAKLEEQAGSSFMRSPYKLASYNVHASPKGVYYRLGNMDVDASIIAGASNAGLTEPAQHTAVSLFEITMLAIGENKSFDDLVTSKIMARLEREIPLDFFKTEKQLRRDDKRYRDKRPR